MKRILCIALALALFVVIAAAGFGWWVEYRPITLDAETSQSILLEYADEIALVEEQHNVSIEVLTSATLEPIKATAVRMYTDESYDFSGLMDTLSLAFYAARH